MAPLSFLKSSSSSSPAHRAPSPGSSHNRNRSPSPEHTTSRYNPARLLRRKPSFSHKSSTAAHSPARISVDSKSTPPVPSMIGGSEIESSEHETEEPRTASSAFFSDIGDPPGCGIGLGFGDGRIQDGMANRTFGSPRSKRDGGIWSGEGTVLMDVIPDTLTAQSPTRQQFFTGDTSGSERPTPTTPSSRRIMEPAELFLNDSAAPGTTMVTPNHLSTRPVTPPVPPLDHPFYPTALSPPRRPMPKSSPRPTRSTPPLQPPQLVSSSSFSAFPPDIRPRHVSSPSLDSKGMSRGTSSTSGSGSGGLIVELQDPPVEARRPVVSAEWLARKPSTSSSASKLGRKNSIGAERINKVTAQSQATTSSSPSTKRRIPQRSRSARRTQALQAGTDSDSPSISQDSDAEVGVGSGVVGKRRSISARDGYEVEVTCDDSHWPGPEDESGEITWQVKIRRQPRLPQSVVNGQGQDYGLPTVAPSSPLQLSTERSRATAPGTASSINLSLSLDQPTGKLVFIAFPMDLHATPRRRGSQSQSHSASTRRSPGPPTPPLPPSPRDLFSASTGPSGSSDAPPLPTSAVPPSTPPRAPAFQPSTPQSRSSSRLDRPEYPITPTRVRLSGQFSPAANGAGTGSGGYASPRSRGSSSIARSLSPAFSGGTPGSVGNGYISPGTYGTPTGSAARRGTRLVSAPDLEGGLYAPGTVDGLSEELESTTIEHR